MPALVYITEIYFSCVFLKIKRDIKVEISFPNRPAVPKEGKPVPTVQGILVLEVVPAGVTTDEC